MPVCVAVDQTHLRVEGCLDRSMVFRFAGFHLQCHHVVTFLGCGLFWILFDICCFHGKEEGIVTRTEDELVTAGQCL